MSELKTWFCHPTKRAIVMLTLVLGLVLLNSILILWQALLIHTAINNHTSTLQHLTAIQQAQVALGKAHSSDLHKLNQILNLKTSGVQALNKGQQQIVSFFNQIYARLGDILNRLGGS